KSKSPIKRIEQPQRGCGRLCASGNRHNRVAVEIFVWTVTQGSAFRATLGFGSESRWDSPNAQFKNRSSQSSGTRNFGGHFQCSQTILLRSSLSIRSPKVYRGHQR